MARVRHIAEQHQGIRETRARRNILDGLTQFLRRRALEIETAISGETQRDFGSCNILIDVIKWSVADADHDFSGT